MDGIKWLALTVALLGCSPALVTDIAYETADKVACGYNLGEKICDISLTDQNGDSWSLYDNGGKITIIDLSAMWCGPCRAAAKEADEVVEHFGKDKVQWVTILIENSHGEPPILDDLQQWAASYHASSPILAGDRSLIDSRGVTGFPLTSWPTFVILDEQMNIVEVKSGWNRATIQDLVERNL